MDEETAIMYVGEVHTDVTEAEVIDRLETMVGPVKEVQLVMGGALVEFKRFEDAELLMDIHQVCIPGVTVREAQVWRHGGGVLEPSQRWRNPDAFTHGVTLILQGKEDADKDEIQSQVEEACGTIVKFEGWWTKEPIPVYSPDSPSIILRVRFLVQECVQKAVALVGTVMGPGFKVTTAIPRDPFLPVDIIPKQVTHQPLKSDATPFQGDIHHLHQAGLPLLLNPNAVAYQPSKRIPVVNPKCRGIKTPLNANACPFIPPSWIPTAFIPPLPDTASDSSDDDWIISPGQHQSVGNCVVEGVDWTQHLVAIPCFNQQGWIPMQDDTEVWYGSDSSMSGEAENYVVYEPQGNPLGADDVSLLSTWVPPVVEFRKPDTPRSPRYLEVSVPPPTIPPAPLIMSLPAEPPVDYRGWDI